MMNELILATNNAGKIAEIQALLAPIVCVSQANLGIPSIAETGLSFVENALIKARHVSAITKKVALADDSGLVVNALNGAPGIYSARFAGPESSDAANVDCLLQQLRATPDGERQAYFYCAMVLVQRADDPTPVIAWGHWSGIIAQSPVGNQGFGYDPVFYLPALQCTAAELPAGVKNTISHRAIALKALRKQLANPVC